MTAATPPESVHAEVVVVLDQPAAEKLDGRIRRLVKQVDDQLSQVRRLLDEACRGQIHQTLGFTSWTAYVADVLSGTLELSGDTRRDIHHLMADEGMSLRAIATATGVSKDTVSRDLAQVSHDETPAEAAPATVTGLDGKMHPRHRPAPTRTNKHRRAPLPDQFGVVVAGLKHNVNSLEKLIKDDRFRDFAESNVGHVRRHSLLRSIAALQAVADQFPDAGQCDDTPVRVGEVRASTARNGSGLLPTATSPNVENLTETTP